MGSQARAVRRARTVTRNRRPAVVEHVDFPHVDLRRPDDQMELAPQRRPYWVKVTTAEKVNASTGVLIRLSSHGTSMLLHARK